MFIGKQRMRLFQALGALAIWALCSAANAAPIPSFGYSVTSVFDTGTVAWDPADDAFSSATPTNLTWGSPVVGTNQSMLTITGNPATGPNSGAGTLITDGPANPTQLFTHFNRRIFSNSAHLDAVTVNATLTLSWDATSSIPAGGLGPVSTSFFVNFQETVNFPASGFCADGTPTPALGCPDIFVLDATLNAFSFSPGDGFTYFVSIIETSGNLTPLNPLLCAEAGSSSPCLGFVTPEGADTPAQFAFLITTKPIGIPEPGSLALLGAVVLALAAVRRRRLA